MKVISTVTGIQGVYFTLKTLLSLSFSAFVSHNKVKGKQLYSALSLFFN